MWVKGIALSTYAVVLLVTAMIVLSAIKTLENFPTLPLWRPDQLAQTGAFMLLFTITAILLQAKSSPSAFVAFQVGVTGFLLLVTFLRHGFPDQSAIYAAAHLICAVCFSCWNILKIVRLGL